MGLSYCFVSRTSRGKAYDGTPFDFSAGYSPRMNSASNDGVRFSDSRVMPAPPAWPS